MQESRRDVLAFFKKVRTTDDGEYMKAENFSRCGQLHEVQTKNKCTIVRSELLHQYNAYGGSLFNYCCSLSFPPKKTKPKSGHGKTV